MESNLVKRQLRIESRQKSIDKNHCPNCNKGLREKWHGGLHCLKCGWEKHTDS
mgnify:CR=1 FL=1